MNREERLLKSKIILESLGIENPEYLGEGKQGVVFFKEAWVYKIIFKCSNDFTNAVWYQHFFKTTNFKGNCFYKLEDVIQISEEIAVEKYKYEKGEKITKYSESEVIMFLASSWQNKVVVVDCKPENFIRVNDKLKMIDMDAVFPYSDNLFLNACLRMFICSREWPEDVLKKLQRSAINNFSLPELDGFSAFLSKVFNQIIFNESDKYISERKFEKKDLVYEEYSVKNLPNLEGLFFLKLKENLYLSDVQVEEISIFEDGISFDGKVYVGYKKIKKHDRKISLLIKTSAMDVFTIEPVAKHIVRQLVCPENFDEIVLSIDSKKENFLRQYTNNSDYDKVLQIAQKLQKEKVIDRFIIFNPEKAGEINKTWFNLETSQTHSSTNVPVASQLYAFENCCGDYIFQMDSDVMIGRKDFNHNYLQDMISELESNEKVISVGFNIYNKESKEYFGFEDGGFVPEVRMGLFHKERFFAQRPLPNSLNSEGKLNLTWYRSMEAHQKATGVCSIRGGDSRTFFIHPQNYRKTETYTWLNILDRVEQMEIPDCQFGNFDCEGSFYDWCGPKRKEKVVVVSVINDTNAVDFLRFWASLISQNFYDFGIILYDNYSGNGISILIQNLLSSYKTKVTFIKGRTKLTDLQCEFISIRNICADQNSVIVCVDSKNALVGSGVLSDLYEKYKTGQCDLTCGVSFKKDKVMENYRQPVDFVHPRSISSNVWDGLISFRKYLFDSIPLNHLIYENPEIKMSQRKWYEFHKEMVKMIPMVEMSSLPLQMNFINYYENSSCQNKTESREKIGTDLEKKNFLTKNDLISGRKKFITNKSRIDIDITFLCNLNCKGCIRSCGEAPSKDRMTLDDIKNFINESIIHNKKWQRINVLGGEPTLHPEFLEILKLLQEYADEYNPALDIQVVSNGKNLKSQELCKEAEKFKNVRVDYNSYKKDSEIEFFTPFNDAPCDDDNCKNSDFSKACWVAVDSGFGLNKNGYYACPNCSGIDRVLGLGIGLKSFADLTEEIMQKQFEVCCKYCGFFKHYDSNLGYFIPRNQRAPFKNIISESWKKIYEKYNEK